MNLINLRDIEDQKKLRECWELNPGWLGEKLRRYLCAMPTPQIRKSLIIECFTAEGELDR